jgi:hypothetical protein
MWNGCILYILNNQIEREGSFKISLERKHMSWLGGGGRSPTNTRAHVKKMVGTSENYLLLS